MSDPISGEEWMRYALLRIRHLVDKPRERMTEDELTIYTFAQNALSGGEPVIRAFARGPGVYLCRLCLAEWSGNLAADHVHRCPMGGRSVPS